MQPMTMIAGWAAFWLLWMIAGIFFDPLMDPRGKSSTQHTPMRFFMTFAYITTVSVLVWVSRQFGNGRDKTFGERAVGVGVMLTRKHANRAVLRVRGVQITYCKHGTPSDRTCFLCNSESWG